MAVKLVSCTPNAEEILVQAFSQCYQLERQGKKANIDVVRRNIKHQSVLEHATYTFNIEMSRVAWEQLVRQRIGTAFEADHDHIWLDSITYNASYTAQSHRYTEPTIEDFSRIMPPSVTDLGKDVEWHQDMAVLYQLYSKWREYGLKKEDARYIAPCGILIRATVTFNLRSLIHLWLLRLDAHAQWEIRAFARECLEAVLPTIPNLVGIVQELAGINEA
ncbi:MAG: FAD-dependent thymidylate synthase [Peptococcaceae bacterium]|nr:FAD-dependent thymidylate synthase [Peptococcaceae bacterium]